MKKIICILSTLLAIAAFCGAKTKTADREAIYQTNLHCKNCAAKIQDNVSFEKGVKGLSIDVDAKTVRIRYNPDRTDAAKLCKSIEKLGYKVELISDKSL